MKKTFDLENNDTYSLKFNKEMKEILQKFGASNVRTILYGISDYIETIEKTPEIDILIMLSEMELDRLKATYEKNNIDIEFHKKQYETIKSDNEQLIKVIQDKNVKLRGLYDKQSKIKDELNSMLDNVIKILHNDKFRNNENYLIEVEISEVIDDRVYCERNDIIKYIISQLDNPDDIKVLESCLL